MQVNLHDATWRQLTTFVFVGVLNTAFGYGAFLLFVCLRLGPAVALALATIIGVIFNFFTTGHLVFRNATHNRAWLFVLGYAITYCVNLALLRGLIAAGLMVAQAQAICLPLVVLLSFAINKYIVFDRVRS